MTIQACTALWEANPPLVWEDIRDAIQAVEKSYSRTPDTCAGYVSETEVLSSLLSRGTKTQVLPENLQVILTSEVRTNRTRLPLPTWIRERLPRTPVRFGRLEIRGTSSGAEVHLWQRITHQDPIPLTELSEWTCPGERILELSRV